MAGLSEHVRLFTAVEIDGPIRRAVRNDAESLLRNVGKVSLVAEANLHVTLKFIGEVHRDDIAAVGEVVAEGAERLREGRVTVEGIGAFPDRSRPRVIWAGVSDPEGILVPVHARLNDTLTRFGAKREKKRFVPHVTVARVRGARVRGARVRGARVRGRFDAALFAERLDRGGEFWFGEQAVGAIVLFMSELGRGGPPVYTALGHYKAG